MSKPALISLSQRQKSEIEAFLGQLRSSSVAVPTDDDVIESYGEVAAASNISLRHLQRLFAGGLGPPTISLGKRRRGVRRCDRKAWIASRRDCPAGWHDNQGA